MGEMNEAYLRGHSLVSGRSGGALRGCILLSTGGGRRVSRAIELLKGARGRPLRIISSGRTGLLREGLKPHYEAPQVGQLELELLLHRLPPHIAHLHDSRNLS